MGGSTVSHSCGAGTVLLLDDGDHRRPAAATEITIGSGLQCRWERSGSGYLPVRLDSHTFGVVGYVADQLATTSASDELMHRYVERDKTPLEHSWEIREALGCLDFASAEPATRDFLEARACVNSG